MRRWLMVILSSLGLVALSAPRTSAGEVKPAWQQEWEQVLAAAKREGKVTVLGPTGSERRQVLGDLFEKKYGIPVEYAAGQGSAKAAQIQAERAAGQYLWDVFVTGASTMVAHLFPMGIMDPVEPALLLPEVKDLNNWREGQLLFTKPKERLGLVMVLGTREPGIINTDLVKPGEITSYRDLLAPKWKGKIVVGRSPTVSGAAQAAFALFYAHPDLGPDFIRALAKQNLIISGNDRQAGEFVARGRAAIGIGTGEIAVAPFLKEGLPIATIDPRKIKEGTYASPGAGAVTLLKNAPHPNAAKVYINWLLSREGQTAFSKVMTTPSWRVDVPWDGEPSAIPRPGDRKQYGEAEMEVTDKARPLIEELFGR